MQDFPGHPHADTNRQRPSALQRPVMRERLGDDSESYNSSVEVWRDLRELTTASFMSLVQTQSNLRGINSPMWLRC